MATDSEQVRKTCLIRGREYSGRFELLSYTGMGASKKATVAHIDVALGKNREPEQVAANLVYDVDTRTVKTQSPIKHRLTCLDAMLGVVKDALAPFKKRNLKEQTIDFIDAIEVFQDALSTYRDEVADQEEPLGAETE